MGSDRSDLGDRLVAAGLLGASQLDAYRELEGRHGTSLRELLVQAGITIPADLDEPTILDPTELSPPPPHLDRTEAYTLGAPPPPTPTPTPTPRAPNRGVQALLRAESPDEIGRYAIVRELGRGGMGVVLEAHDPTLDRRVAIKLLHPSFAEDERAIARFQREARAVAKLRHPGIVSVHEVGTMRDGTPFLVMDFVAGTTLEAWLDDELRDPKEVAVAIAAVARACHAAHERGIVHRDVKPRNVMVTDDDADGAHPILMDFGLAHDGGASALTATGQVLGTPNYMAPEQVRGKRGTIGPAADVYALGATLYRGLCGRPPFLARSAVAILRMVLEDEPSPPRKVLATVPRALDAIVRRCLAKAPEDRYPSAAELADELDRFVAGERLESTPSSAASTPRAGRRPPRVAAVDGAGRRPPSLAAIGGVLAVLFIATVIAGFASRGSSRPPARPPVATRVSLEEPADGLVTSAARIQVRGRLEGALDAVWIGERGVPIDADGRFDADVDLPDADGPTAITVTATPQDEQPLATTRVLVDRTPPVVRLDAETADRTVVSAATLVVRGVVDDAHPRSAAAEGAADPDAELAPDGRFELTVVLPEHDGVHPIEVIATDAAGHTGRARLEVIVDRTPPTLRIEEAELTVATGDAIRGVVVDDHPAAVLAGEERVSVDEDGRFVIPVEGLGELSLIAVDEAGLRSEPTRIERVAPTRPAPSITIDAPPTGFATREARVAVRGTVVADGPDPIDVTVEGEPVAVDADGRWEAQVELGDEGKNHIEVVAASADAGPVERASIDVTRDTRGPTITLDPEPAAERWGPEERDLLIAGSLDEASSLEVAGDPVEVDADAHAFGHIVRLRTGENAVEIVARDALGNETRRTLAIRWTRRRPKTEAMTPWWKPTREQVAWAKRSGWPLCFENELGMRFALIPPGRFTMGSPPAESGRRDDETSHPVTLTAAYYVAATETDNATYRMFRPEHSSAACEGVSLDGDRQPVVGMAWGEAVAFCAWLGARSGEADLYRLPTEAEWERAARGGTSSAYPWGDQLEDGRGRVNATDEQTRSRFGFPWRSFPWDDGFAASAPTGSLETNPFGLHDVVGNVAEWCADRYGPYPTDPVTDPAGPATGDRRVLRGGNWCASPGDCRVARRVPHVEDRGNNDIGFRVIATRPAPSRPRARGR